MAIDLKSREGALILRKCFVQSGSCKINLEALACEGSAYRTVATRFEVPEL